MVGYRYDDYSRLRRYGTENVFGNVRRGVVRSSRSINHSVTSSCDRIELFNVLFAHTGKVLLPILNRSLFGVSI